MKTLLKALPIVLLSSLAGHSAQAEIEHETKKSIALVSSGIIGGILGGPVGFIVAGVGGALVVDAVFDENSLPEKAPPQSIAQQVASETMTTERIFRFYSRYVEFLFILIYQLFIMTALSVISSINLSNLTSQWILLPSNDTLKFPL